MSAPLAPGVTAVQDAGGRDALRLVGPGGAVRLTRLGAHVQAWEVPGHGDVLFASAAADHGAGVATRGGVPLVFPWFGGHAAREDLPAHGFARIREWTVTETGPGPSVTLRLVDDATTRAAWPHGFRAELQVSLAEGLRLALTVTNTSADEFVFEEALHTYFAVGDVRRASVHGLEGVPFTEFARAPQAAPSPGAPIVFEAETDRVFQGVPDDLELRCPALGHRVALHTRGATSTVVWNPWSAKAAAMSQLRDDEWREFVCVESANCKDGARRLAPGQSHTLELTLRVDAAVPRDA